MRKVFAAGFAIPRCNAPSWLAYCATQPSPWGTAGSRATCPNCGSGLRDPIRCLPKPLSGPRTVSLPRRWKLHPDRTSGAAYYVGGVESFGSLLAFELDCIALVQRLVSVLLDRGEMHKYLLTSGTLDKTISFF